MLIRLWGRAEPEGPRFAYSIGHRCRRCRATLTGGVDGQGQRVAPDHGRDLLSRRSAPRREVNDRAFRIRPEIRVPPTGLGNVPIDVLAWRGNEIGRADHAQHTGRTLGGDAVKIRFRRTEDLLRLVEAFPGLADAT